MLPRLVQVDAPLLDGRRRVHRRRQVDAGQLPGRRAGQRARRTPSDDALARARPPPRRRRLVRPAADPARARAHRRAPPPTPAPCSWSPPTAMPQGLALLDAPDIDSVVERNRSLAAQLLAAADLWLFVTSAARYADQVPWGFLKQAAERSAAVAIVLDRTAAGALAEVSGHLARMLTSARAQGLAAVHRRRRRRSTSRGCCPPRRSRTSAAGCTSSAPTSRPATAWSARPSTAPSARSRGAPTTSPTPARRRPTCAPG